MTENNKTCYTCGKEYRYCPNCADFAGAPDWMNEYDSEDCKKIFDTLNPFWFGYITKEQANEMLKGIDLNKVTNPDLLVAVKKLKEKNEDKKPVVKKTDK